jgi:hypothetical protein
MRKPSRRESKTRTLIRARLKRDMEQLLGPLEQNKQEQQKHLRQKQKKKPQKQKQHNQEKHKLNM